MIRFLIYTYILIIVADSIMSYFPQYKNHPWVEVLRQAADLTLKPVRSILPPDLPVDLSPLVVILGLNLVMALW